MYLKLKLNLTAHSLVCVPLQASRAGRVGSNEHEAEGEAPPVSVPGPDVLGESGRPAGHRQAHRCHREAGQGSPHLHQRLRDQIGGHECLKRAAANYR